MAWRGQVSSVGTAAAIAAALAGCAAPEASAPAGEGGIRLSYEDVLAPAAFRREGPAVADRPEGSAGLWAVTPGLPRPERALVENLATGETVVVALFAGRGGPGGAIRLSAAAAEAIGIGAAPARVRVTALRREPQIAGP